MSKKLLTFMVTLAILVAALVFAVPPAFADDDDDDDGGGGGGGTVTVVFGSGDGNDQFTTNSDCATNLQTAPTVPPFEIGGVQAWADPIPGTQWISVDQNHGAPAPPPFICYQRIFDLPANCDPATATLSVILHVDNDVGMPPPDGGIFLNDVRFGGTDPGGPNPAYFQDPPEGPFVALAPFLATGNQLEFRAHDQGVATGLDYEATLTCTVVDGGGEDDDDDDDGDDDDGDDD